MGIELDKKITQSIRLIKTFDGLNPELSYSGGKDSDVILALAQMSGIGFTPIYKMTTIDPPGTIAHVRKKIQGGGICGKIIKPQKTFFELIQQSGFPTMRARFCCSVLKEYKILDKQILGIRKAESDKRKKRYNEPMICRIYGNKNSRVEQMLPILTWTNKDVEEFINYYGIKCHPLYYNENGTFDAKRRLGCMGCPLKSDRGKSDFLKYPKLMRQWIRNGSIWMETHPNVASHERFGNIYNLFFHNVFCKSYADYLLKTNGLFGSLNTKTWLEDYFEIDLP